MLTAKLTAKKGGLAGARVVREDQELIFISQTGMVQRTAVGGISRMGRPTQGVRVMNLKKGDLVSAVALVVESTDQNGNGASASGATVEEEAPTAGERRGGGSCGRGRRQRRGQGVQGEAEPLVERGCSGETGRQGQGESCEAEAKAGPEEAKLLSQRRREAEVGEAQAEAEAHGHREAARRGRQEAQALDGFALRPKWRSLIAARPSAGTAPTPRGSAARRCG